MVGARLRQMREAAGISRPVLARAAGIGESHLTDLEKGVLADPKVSTFVRIVKGLAAVTGQPPMQVLEYLLQDALVDTNAPAGGGR